MISGSQEDELIELIERYEGRSSNKEPLRTDELMRLRWLAVQAYKEQRKQLGMMRG